MLDTEFLQGTHGVARSRRASVSVVSIDGGQRSLAILGRDATIQLVQHGSGSHVLGLLLATSASGGRQIPEDNLEAEGWRVRGSLSLDNAILWSYSSRLKPLLESSNRVGLIVTHVGAETVSNLLLGIWSWPGNRRSVVSVVVEA